MLIEVLTGKIHRATVTEANLDYVGSITLDEKLMEEASILEYQKVQVADVDNGKRLETYVIKGEAGSGTVCLNGAAAHLVDIGDKVIIMAYGAMTPEEAASHKPSIVFVNDKNEAISRESAEHHGAVGPSF